MDKQTETYFEILRAYLWPEISEVRGERLEVSDWEGVMQIAARQGTLPLVADYALKLTEENAPSSEQKMLMKQVAMQNMLHQQKLRGYLKMVKDCLDEAGIPFVLLKGFGLASLYPNPAVRSSGDVDIWVGQERFHEACAVLRTLPEVVTYNHQENDGTRHFNLHWCNQQYVVEVHPVAHSFVSNRENARYLELENYTLYTLHRTLSLDGVEYRVPSTEFNALYVFLHLWHHYLTEGVQMKQLIDWMLVLHQLYTVHHTPYTLEKDLSLFHLTEPWQAFGEIVVKHLGLPREEFPLWEMNNEERIKKSDQVLQQIMQGCRREYRDGREFGQKGFTHKLDVLRYTWLDYQETKRMFPDYAKHVFWVTIKKGLKI